MVKGDHNLICSTWITRLLHNKPKPEDHWYENHIEQIERSIFFKNYNRVINHLLIKENVKVTLCCLKEDPDVILGYIVYETSPSNELILHWMYVKEAWRNLGIARGLMPKGLKYITHLTRPGITLKRKFGLIYNPFLI